MIDIRDEEDDDGVDFAGVNLKVLQKFYPILIHIIPCRRKRLIFSQPVWEKQLVFLVLIGHSSHCLSCEIK